MEDFDTEDTLFEAWLDQHHREVGWGKSPSAVREVWGDRIRTPR